MKYYFLLSTLGLSLALFACSKDTSTSESFKSTLKQMENPQVIKNPSQRIYFKGLDQFNGRPPWDLVKDDVIGKSIKTIVPQSQFKCMDDIFNYMPDLELQSDGSVQASLNGAHVDQFMEAFISASPNGSLNIVLNCDPQATPKGMYQFFTNEEPKAIPANAVLDWMYVVGHEDDKVLRSDGEKMAEMPFNTFVQVVAPASKPAEAVATALTRAVPSVEAHPSTKVSAAPQAGATTFPLVGEWSCKSSKPGSASFSTAFKFDAQGGFVYVDPQSQLIGRYQPSGSSTSVTVEQAKVNGQIVPSSMLVRIDSIVTAPGQSKFKMTLVKLGTEVVNTCVTKAVAAATPAPQVDVCSINPAACASVQRNSDIRSQIQDQRCAMLRSQLSGMVGADYQLAKAGCR